MFCCDCCLCCFLLVTFLFRVVLCCAVLCYAEYDVLCFVLMFCHVLCCIVLCYIVCCLCCAVLCYLYSICFADMLSCCTMLHCAAFCSVAHCCVVLLCLCRCPKGEISWRPSVVSAVLPAQEETCAIWTCVLFKRNNISECTNAGTRITGCDG